MLKSLGSMIDGESDMLTFCDSRIREESLLDSFADMLIGLDSCPFLYFDIIERRNREGSTDGWIDPTFKPGNSRQSGDCKMNMSKS